jgi:DNA-binding MarR family transcriptional regulator
MSNHSKRELITEIGRRVQSFQDAADALDEAVATRLRLNRTDLRCLSVLSQAGAASASALADAAGLSRGAMTTALDRLETAGLARRVRDRDDRRSVRVELSDAARREIEGLYGPLAIEGARLLERYTVQQLEAVARYLEDGRELQRAHARRIRGLGEREPSSRRGGPE